MRITPTGVVSIGTTTPVASVKLQVDAGPLGTSASDQLKYQIFSSTNPNNGDFLEITNTRQVAGNEWYGAGSRLQQRVDASYMGYVQFNGGVAGARNDAGILFGTGQSASPTGVLERMRIDTNGNVGIGTATPNASALLDVQSTTKGVRMPNMTTAQKNAITTPAAGLMVFDTDLVKLCVYTGSAWQTITST